MTLADLIAKKVRAALAGALKDEKPDLTDVAEAGGRAAAGGVLGDVQRFTDIISNLIGDALSIIEFVFPPLKMLEAVEDAGGKLGRGVGLGYLFGYAAWTAVTPVLEPINHAVADLFQTAIFDPATAAQLQAKRIITREDGRSEAAGGNLSGEHYDKLVEMSQAWPALAELHEMHRRRALSDSEYQRGLERAGIPAEMMGAVRQLERNLLSAADLALAFLRTEIDDKTLEQYAGELGVTPADMQVLIGNTGEPPGLMELLEAYRRGFIDRPRLERGIRQSRVRNEWIDVIERLRLSPMSTADAVRAVIEHYLTDEQGRKIAEQNGLEPDHWRPMVDSWGRPLSHEQMMVLYHRGKVTLEQVRQAFRESDMKDKYSDQSIELGRRLIPERTIVTMIHHGVLPLQEGARKLLEQGFNEQDAALLIKLGAAEQKSSQRDLNKTDVVNLYEQHLLPKDQAVAHLHALGYSDADATWILQLADTKAHATQVRAETQRIRASFLAGRLDAAQARNQLTALGLDANQAERNLALWAREKGRATRGLTEAQIIKAIGSQALTVARGKAQLIALGLSSADADVLLLSHGIKVA